jgi:hypothetical protein
MRKRTCAFGLVGALAIVMLTPAVRPAAAAIVYPWCAYYAGADSGNAPSCGSSTYEQCMATVSGQMGYCARNPFYVAPVPQPAPGRKPARS